MEIFGRTFTIGADPEIFVGKGGQFVSAHNLIPGTKQEPFKVKSGAVQVDGMACEFNIDPADDYEMFQANLDQVQNILKGMIGDNEFLNKVSVEFDDEFTKNIPMENLILGCEMDFNGWTVSDNPSPNAAQNMRTAGGHIHIGGFHTDDEWDWDHFQDSARLARLMDEEVGVYSILWDKDDKRRSMYGQAGCFRPKKYGMEYRTMSNQWLFNRKITEFVFNGAKRAIERAFDTEYEPSPEIQRIINESDRDSDFFKDNLLAEEVMDYVH